MQLNCNNNNNNTSVIEVIIDETTPLLPINFSPISTPTVDDGSQFYKPWCPSDQYEVISLSSDDNNTNSRSSSSNSSSNDCPSLESIPIRSNSNETSILISTEDVEVLEINDMAEVRLIDELKKWGLNTEPECAFG